MFEMLKVVNRRSISVEAMFAGQVIQWAPGEVKPLPKNVAMNIYRDTLLQLDGASGVAMQYALGVEGVTDCTPLTGPIATRNRVEVFDRTNQELLAHSEPHQIGKDGPIPIGKGKARGRKSQKVKRTRAQQIEFVNPEEPLPGPQHMSAFSDSHGGSRVVSKSQ